ncbi:MAG: serine/threonine-protein kinase [Pseudomonadota bacterium]
MTPERWEQISKILADALEQPAADRSAFISEACGSDREMRDEVESLLSRQADANAFFDRFADDLTPDTTKRSDIPSLSGTDVGPYRLTEVIGRGGMGVVYRAARNDGAFEQEVALKLLPTGVSEDHLQRFEAERQILAPLQHPHIARLLDGGFSADGTPYFVMDYVDGVPITQYCDAQQLDVRQRLKLFGQVCSAVQYAHQNLVVHRDLKPSNILVTDGGVVKLLDFGIAKLLDQSARSRPSLTQVGARVMTPEYASPEQIRGDSITTSSDVYQLGVLLYELLTGRRPYKAIAIREMERIILEEEPTRPSTAITMVMDATPETSTQTHAMTTQKLQRELRGDLDQIILKALSKRPDHRYSSVEAMADDLGRHLQGMPVLAQGNRWTYVASKFMRRHRTGIGALALTFSALAVGLGAALWQGKIAADERDRAQQQERLASEVAGFMKGMFFFFASSVPEGTSPSPMDVLQQGVVRAEQIDDDRELAGALLHEIADLHIWIREYPKADELFERTLELRQTPRGQMAVLERLATSARLQNQLDRAMPLYEQAVAIGDEFLAEDDLDMASVLNTYGIALSDAEELETAERIQRRVVAIREAQPMDNHSDRAQLAAALDNLGVIIAKSGRLMDALSYHEQGLAYREMISQDVAGENMDVAWSLLNIMSIQALLAEWDQLLEHADRQIRIADSTLGSNHRMSVGGRRLKALALLEQGELDDARLLHSEAESNLRDNAFADKEELLLLGMLGARIEREAGAVATSEQLLRDLWPALDEQWQTNKKSAFAGLVAIELGKTLVAASRIQEALEWFELAVLIETQSRPAGHYRVGIAHLELAEASAKAADRVEHAQVAIDFLEPVFGESHPLTQRAQSLLRQ